MHTYICKSSHALHLLLRGDYCYTSKRNNAKLPTTLKYSEKSCSRVPTNTKMKGICMLNKISLAGMKSDEFVVTTTN